MSTLGHVQYIRGYHYECGRIPCVHRGMFSTSENIISTWGGGYQGYTGLCSAHQMEIMMHLGEQLDKSFQFLLKTPMYSWYPLMYWTSLNVLMVSPTCIMISPTCIMISPNVLNILQCIHDIPLPDALMVPSDVFNTSNILMRFPQCTEHPRCTERFLESSWVWDRFLLFMFVSSPQMKIF